MSAITGIFYRDGRTVEPNLIKMMNDKLSHRGPDGSAVWSDRSVAFGHQMLWTTPESLHEKQPFHDEKAGLVITSDARIDNRKDLSKELDIEDNENVSDSYFILKSYEKWGEKCTEHLLGDFAFAIWDQNEEKLFCARDHMGVKPFYYYLDDNMFIFATEIKALFTIQNVPYNLNKLKMADHLCFLFNDKELTFYDGIFRLSPAHIIIIDIKNIRMNKYWDLDINKEIILDSDEEYSKAFLEIFNDAVNCRLRSAFPLGSLLSGGIDSSSIVCIARELLKKVDNKNLETYSATFEGTPECDEQFYINKVLEGGRLNSHFIKADNLSPLSQIENILWHLEEPNFAVNFYFHWHIHQKAMQNGVRVILEGFDGDTTLSHGEKFLIDYFKSFKWIKGIKEFYLHSKLVKKNISRKELLLSFVISLSPIFMIDLMKLLPLFPKGIFGNCLISEELSKETKIKKRLKKYENQYISASRSSKAFHYYRLNSGLESNLEIIDKSASAANLEARYPFFDRRLIEFCFALPLEQKINNGWTRIILRRAMENILPVEIQWRPDKGMLGQNFRKNFLLYEKRCIEDILFNRSYLIKDYVNMDSIYKIYDIYLSNKSTSVLSIFGVITLGIWIQKIFNKSFK